MRQVSMDLQEPHDAIHPDTQAGLLLIGTFAKEIDPDAKPLNLREYNALAKWLVQRQKRPADLLTDAVGLYEEAEAGLPESKRIRALLSRGMQMAAAVERWQRLGLWVVGRGEERYPKRLLRHLHSSAPPLLYGAGDMARLALGGLAIVGSRDIDEEGLAIARRVAERCAGADMQVISGGARGVDQAALSGALAAGGGVVAVLSDRLDRVATSREAKEHIRGGVLTLVTPYEPEANFTVGRAMGRNKIIYTLADYALVVRFTKGEGGSWAGAVEQLGRNDPEAACVPVFVRVARNPEEGWRELREKGARPFPEDEFWVDAVAEVLNRAATDAGLPQKELWDS
jgi:predicted Rossmann fold nucleotide-binding protein DprA/Smf involved in DNA uptake